MIPTLEQAVLVELAAVGPVPQELRLLARDRTERPLVALAHLGNAGPLGGFRATVAARVASVMREEHAAGVRFRGG